MGSILSRRIAGVEDIDIQANSAYRYPPKSGNYFASHFFMGGEKFDTPHPEGYLFGENMDLNFLGNRPVQFPYVTPAPQEPVKTLRSLVNIRKDSLRLARYKDDADSPTDEGTKPRALYGVEFTFDSDARVAITIYCQAFEEFSNGMAIYNPKTPALVSETVYYKRGVSQQFTLPSFKMDFSEWKEEDLNFDLDRGVFPMVIQAVVDEGDDCLGHAHVLLAAFERHVDGSFSVKPLKQKQIVDRVSYLGHMMLFFKDYFVSSMPRLSQTLRFQQSPSFRQAQSALIGQLTQCIVIGRTPQALVGNLTALPIIASFIFQNKCKDSPKGNSLVTDTVMKLVCVCSTQATVKTADSTGM
uniref:E3 ubiquitin-protein ligase n=1 Tax=Sinocyclocheilus grahami TaxID=75366 RepID=A0A672MND1_SINGR